jgi:carbon storage regulator CsrA
MLVLSRRANEKIVFPSIGATIQVVAVKPGVVRLGIDAPGHLPIFRAEVLQRATLDELARARQGCRSAEAALRQLTQMLNNSLDASSLGLARLRRQLDPGHPRDVAATIDQIERELRLLKQRAEDAAGESFTEAPRPRRRALLVEDDRNECELLAGFLRLAGLDVATAGDGADALDYLQTRGRPDVILLDMVLPRLDGPTCVRTIRRDPAYAGLKIFGVTGVMHETFGLEKGPQGIDRWFRKPLNPELLLRQLNEDFSEMP